MIPQNKNEYNNKDIFIEKKIKIGKTSKNKTTYTIKSRERRNYYDILENDEIIENGNCIVPQIALDMKFEELQNEHNTFKKCSPLKDKQLTKVENENVALKRKIEDMEEERNVERMSLKALEGFLAAENEVYKRNIEMQKQMISVENGDIKSNEYYTESKSDKSNQNTSKMSTVKLKEE